MDADFTVNTMIGSQTYPYRGIFDGNGHTLNVNISSGDGAAPFRNAQNYIIQNLRITGSVNGARYASGLVGYIYGSNNTITNCRVSAKVTTTGDRVAGFVGYTSYSVTNISNCLENGTYENFSDLSDIGFYRDSSNPHGIIIPGKWQWPTEKTCIKNAYKDFITWASDRTKSRNWYTRPEADKVVKR